MRCGSARSCGGRGVAVEGLGSFSTATVTLSGVPVRRAGELAGPAIAARSAVERNRNLAPERPGWEEFLAWAEDVGIVYQDPEDGADDYVEMCHLMGWPLAPDATPEPVSEPPPLPAIDVLAVAESPTIASSGASRSLEASQAAEAFVEWVRIFGKCGTYSSRDLGKLYAEHCEDQGFDELSIKVFRPALLKCDGVRRFERDCRFSGKRNKRGPARPTMWEILPVLAASSPIASETEDVPWTDLPRRKAA